MFTDEQRDTYWNEIRQHDLEALGRILTPELLAEAVESRGAKLGRGPLNAANMVWLSLLAALHGDHDFEGVLELLGNMLKDCPGPVLPGFEPPACPRRARGRRSKYSPYGQDVGRVSEESFVEARQRMDLGLVQTLLEKLGRRFEQKYPALTHWKGFRILAMDGTKIQLERWAALREHFGTASNGKGGRTVLSRLVMLAYPLARLPLRYLLTPWETSEKTAAGELLEGLDPNDLVMLDAGYWSYGLFWQIQRQRAHFCVRVPQNLKFRTVQWLSRGDRLVEWTPVDRKWKKQGLPRSIQLREITYQIKGFRPTRLITSVLDPQAISREDLVRLATIPATGKILDPGLYHRRWEIETLYEEIKVHQGMEGSLRGRTPATIAYEVAGHVLLYHLIRWLITEAAERQGVPPLRVSFLDALREFKDMRAAFVWSSPEHIRRVLLPQLVERIARHIVPFRPGRHYPRPGDTKTKNKGRGKRRLPNKLAPLVT